MSEQRPTSIRVIDFSDFVTGKDPKAVADAFLESFKTIGFVCLTNHGLSQNKVDKMFEWSKKFFLMPQETKLLAPHPASGTHHRGYSSPGAEQVSQHVYDKEELDALRARSPDVKESYEVGREDDPLMPNIWLPDDVLPGFKEACLDFYWACYELEKDVLRALAISLSLPEEYFFQYHKAADNQLRLLHYPSIPNKHLADESFSRIGAHSDFGTMTFVFQDEVGGLEVEDPQKPGTFIPVPVVANSVVVNAADFMMRWSNDVIKSTIHRVRSPPGSDVNGEAPDRYSIPYFCCCDLSTVVDAIPGTWDETHPKKYDPISAMDYLMKRLAASYQG